MKDLKIFVPFFKHSGLCFLTDPTGKVFLCSPCPALIWHFQRDSGSLSLYEKWDLHSCIMQALWKYYPWLQRSGSYILMPLLEIELTTLILKWKLLCSSGENVQRALVETSESSCHLEMCVLLVQCVCWMRRQDLICPTERGKHKSMGQQHGLRQQWRLKHPKDLLGSKGRAKCWGNMGCSGLCVPGCCGRVAHRCFICCLSVEKVNWMTPALNWHVSELLLSAQLGEGRSKGL